MTNTPLDQRRLQQLAERHDIDWIYRAQTTSTNDEVLAHYHRYRRQCIAVSETQTAGRGRRGRQWLSPDASNIYCTLGIIKTLPASSQGLLSIVTGLALCRSLQHSAAVEVVLKWPNDLLYDGRKLGGILIESKPHDEGNLFFAVGFGLNLFMTAVELAAIAQPVTCLQRISAVDLDRDEILTAGIEAVLAAIREFEPTQVAALITEFQRHDAYDGAPVEVVSGRQRITGIGRGIDASGRLQLETEQGIQLYSAAEISLRPDAE